ncbi:hypothetical protein [Streptomyces sp. NPDC052225]|uniref:hypothetical protein n=1 Tax=Streptomyces sp. NPDC052225 TaxID=3154949 RepID=UPI003436D70B
MSDVRRGRVRAAALAVLLALCALFLSGSCHEGFDTGAVAHHDHHQCAPAEQHVAAAQPSGDRERGGGPCVEERGDAPRPLVAYGTAPRPRGAPPPIAAGHRLLIALGVDRN